MESEYEMLLMKDTYERISCKWAEDNGMPYEWDMSRIMGSSWLYLAQQIANSITHRQLRALRDAETRPVDRGDLVFLDQWLENEVKSDDDRLKLFLWLNLPPKVYDEYHSVVGEPTTNYAQRLLNGR